MIDVSDISNLKDSAVNLANKIQGPSIIFLNGEVGSGKTTFARFFIQYLLKEDIDVPSPTFNIMQLYQHDTPIAHLDLYRLKHRNELYDIGLDYMTQHILLIEWPEIANSFFPNRKVINIVFIHEHETNRRYIDVKFN